MAVQIGQVLEIETPRGLAYVQYVSRHTKYGDTIRVLPGLFKARPLEFSELARERGYFTFYPVKLAAARGLISVVAKELIPSGLEAPRRMRRPVGIARNGRVLTWFIMGDDANFGRHELTPEERRLPIAEIWNHEFLVDRLARGWSPETDGLEQIDTDPVSSGSAHSEAQQNSRGNRAAHYLYFEDERSARAAAADLDMEGFETTVRPSAGTPKWLVLAKHNLPDNEAMERFRVVAERVADAHLGEYDGSEVEVG
jgi:hypothetical protein